MEGAQIEHREVRSLPPRPVSILLEILLERSVILAELAAVTAVAAAASLIVTATAANTSTLHSPVSGVQT